MLVREDNQAGEKGVNDDWDDDLAVDCSLNESKGQWPPVPIL